MIYTTENEEEIIIEEADLERDSLKLVVPNIKLVLTAHDALFLAKYLEIEAEKLLRTNILRSS